jgi:predicted nucleic acid-binding protein
MRVISNTTVLSNFAAIGQLQLLQALYTSLHISTDVYAEMQAGLEEGYRFYAGMETDIYPLSETGWIQMTGVTGEEELRLLSELPRRLHRGEASCLAIAKHRAWILLTDDLAARNEAARLGVPVSGSIGCLVLGVERQVCSLEQANSWLTDMRQHHYWSPVTDLTPLLTHR